jgi:hypothetical protein
MATRAQQSKRAEERSGKPKAKKVSEPSRRQRTAGDVAAQKALPPTKSMKGSEHAQQMKSATAASRHGRRAG